MLARIKNEAVLADTSAGPGPVTGDEEIECLKGSGTMPTLLPGASLFLGMPYAPARKMISKNCQVALASDFNPGSSMTQNMSLVWSIAAIKMGIVCEELLWATTIIPAKSLGRDQDIGSIKVGKKADLVIMDIPNLDYLAYHMGINHVIMTIKNGEVVYKR